MDALREVIMWSDGCSSQFRSKFAFALLTHFDRKMALQSNYNEAHHGKGLMDGVGGTTSWVVHGLVESRHINISIAEEFAVEASNGVPAIKSLYLLQEDDISEPSFSTKLQQLKEPWIYITLSVIIIWKMSVFLISIVCQMIRNLFILSIILNLTLWFAIMKEKVMKWTKTNVVIAKRFTMEIVKVGCSVLPVVSGFMIHALKRKVCLWFS